LISVENSYATSYIVITIGTDILSRTVSELSQLLLFKFGQFTFFDPAFFSVGGVRYKVRCVHLGLIGKRVMDFLLVLIELFSLGVMGEVLYGRKYIENRRFCSNKVSLTQNFR